MTVSVIIVSWNVRDLLKKCLESINKTMSGIEHEVFVVDNNSSDESAEMVKREFPNVNLIENHANMGFAHACNQALKISQGRYLLLLNPDTELIDTSVTKIIKEMDKVPECGIGGCTIKNVDGSIQPSIRKFPDLLSHILILLKVHNFKPDIGPLRTYYQKDFNYQTMSAVDQVMGAFFMIKKKLLEEIGLLDESFYIWYEEVDYCRRAAAKKYKTYYFPQAEVIHQKGKSFAQLSALKKQYIFNRSMLHYFFKHSNIFSYMVLAMLLPISFFLTLLVQVFKIKKKKKEL